MAALRKRSDSFVATTVDDEVLIVDLDRGQLMSLAGTGRAVWEAIDGTRDAAAIARLLAPRYDTRPAEIEVDVAALADELVAARLVTRGQ